eukprot:s1392_g1.t1
MVSRRAMPSAQTIGADAVDVEDPRGRDAQSEAQEAPLKDRKETAERPDCILRWCRCISAVDVLVLLAATVACMASMITGNHQLAVMGLKGRGRLQTRNMAWELGKFAKGCNKRWRKAKISKAVNTAQPQQVYKGQEWREIPLADQEVQATGVGWLELMVTRRLREAVRSDFLDFVVKIREQIIGVAYKVYAYGKQPGNVDPVSIPDVAKIVVVAARTSARRRVSSELIEERGRLLHRNVMKQLVFHPEWMPLLFDDAGEVLPFPQSTPPMQPVKVKQAGAVTPAAGDASLQPLDFDLLDRWPRASATEDGEGFGRCNSLRRQKHLLSLQPLLQKLPSRTAPALILGGMPLEQFEQLLHGMQVQQLVLQNGHALHVARGSGGISPARLPHVPLTQQDLSEVAAAFALPSADLCASAMRAVEGSLHRVSVGYSTRKQIDSISLHVGRLLPGISAAVQKQLTSGSSVFLGPTCSGKTTVLRDAAASSSVMVVDFLGELHQGGLGLARHIVNVDAANPADFIGQVIQDTCIGQCVFL